MQIQFPVFCLYRITAFSSTVVVNYRILNNVIREKADDNGIGYVVDSSDWEILFFTKKQALKILNELRNSKHIAFDIDDDVDLDTQKYELKM